MHLTIEQRATQFKALLEICECSNLSGSLLALEEGMQCAMQVLRSARQRGGSIFLIGNGGSASIASHSATDFIKVAGLRAQTIHESSMLSCMANDYGYENAFARILSTVVRPDDVLIGISSSGMSLNIKNAVTITREKGGQVITLSGFSSDNSLRKLGNLNIWLNSTDYGMVEIGHQFILHNLSDRFGEEKQSVENR